VNRTSGASANPPVSADVARHLASFYAAMGDGVTPMLGEAVRDLVAFMESIQEK
jgi:hypothetical protein